MQVAVGIYGQGLFAAQGKGQFGLFAGNQLLHLAALFGQNIDPVDPVFFAHGVFYRANGGGQGVALYLNNGQMLFNSGINRTGNLSVIILTRMMGGTTLKGALLGTLSMFPWRMAGM